MYVTRNIFSVVNDFIMRCPFIAESEVNFHAAPPQEPPMQGNIDAILVYEGSYDVKMTPEVTGGYNVARRDVFQIRLALLSSDSADYARLFAFIDNFQQWVDYMAAYGQVPSFEGSEITKLWADSAAGENASAKNAQHTIRLHILSSRSFN